MAVLYFYSKVLDDSAQGLPGNTRELREREESFQDMPFITSVLGGMHVSVTVRTFESEWWARTYLRLAETAVAVARFRQGHGRWPEDLVELAPEYIDEVPRDLVFTLGAGSSQ